MICLFEINPPCILRKGKRSKYFAGKRRLKKKNELNLQFPKFQYIIFTLK